jgi:hypothetical protein
MNETVSIALTLAANHPLIALAVILFGVLPWLDGCLRELRFIGECFIVAIRFLKHELHAWRDFVPRLKRELTTWREE